jgi:hypothetical protein
MSDLETLEDDAGEIESMLPLLEKGELTNQDQIKLAELLKDASPSLLFYKLRTTKVFQVQFPILLF